MEGICVTCLSMDRKVRLLRDAHKIELFEYLLGNALNKTSISRYMLCWECMGHLSKILRYREKARRSMLLLSTHVKHSMIISDKLSSKCLSTFGQCKIFTLQINATENSNNPRNIIRVKTDLFAKTRTRAIKVPKRDIGYVKPNTPENVKKIGSDSFKEDVGLSDDTISADDDNKVDIEDSLAKTEVFNSECSNIYSVDDWCMKPSTSHDDVKPWEAPAEENPADSDSTLSADERFDDDDDGEAKNLTSMNQTSFTHEMAPSQSSWTPLKPVTTRGHEQEVETWRVMLLSRVELMQVQAREAADVRYARRPWRCEPCILGFCDASHLDKHVHSCHREELGAHVCDICTCRYADERRLTEHRARHLVLYQCTRCGHSTRDFRNITRHHAQNHSRVVYPCEHCDESFPTYNQYYGHKAARHKTRFQCRCGEEFHSKNLLQRHHRRRHMTVTSAACPVCCKVLRNRYALPQHLATHTEQEAVYCVPCNRFYKNKVSYRGHVSSKHKPDKLRPMCEHCGKKFSFPGEMARHVRSVHLKPLDHKCEQCSKVYSTLKALKVHIGRMHNQAFVVKRDKICDVCGKDFATNLGLKGHMVTHSGERPYHCKLCPSKFGQSAALYTHNKLVHEKVKRKWPKKKPKKKSNLEAIM